MGYSPASAIPLNTFGAPTGNVNMNSHKFTSLLDGSVANDSAGWDQLPANGAQLPYVVSGCVWTADSPGSTLACSMTSGTIVIAGLLYSVSAVTSRSFTASKDTYVDVAISGGTATLTYTEVANWQTSPALANSGTVANTIRLAYISSGSSSVASAGIGQGGMAYATTAGTQGSTTVAAGSNGQAINALTSNQLAVAAITNFPTGGGFIQVAHASGQTYTLQYTGASGSNLTGITSGNVIQGTPTNTVSTSDTVKAICPIAVTDMLGNRIYPTTGFPGLIGGCFFTGAYTTTLTANSPIPGTGASSTTGFIAPFIVPTGPARNVKFTVATPAFGSSATAGTALSLRGYIGNATTIVTFANPNVNVASDNVALGMGAVAPQTAPTVAGSYTGQLWTTQGAAGTLTVGALAVNTTLLIELV